MKNALVIGIISPVEPLTNPFTVNGVIVFKKEFTFCATTVDELAVFIISAPSGIEITPTNNTYIV
jgi:hypothetical protein